jgi:hypothetical protein
MSAKGTLRNQARDLAPIYQVLDQPPVSGSTKQQPAVLTG